MRTPSRFRWIWSLLAVFGLAGTALLVPGWLLPTVRAATAPKPAVQDTPIARDLKANTSLAPVVRKVAPSVVNIYTTKTVRFGREGGPMPIDPQLLPFFGLPFESVPRERRERSLGSGVIVTQDGYILTNSHVVEGADEIKVALADNKAVREAKIIGTDPQTDIAVIKIDAGPSLPAATLADSDTLEVGDLVLAIGNPFGIGQTVTRGIVSAKGRGGMGILDYEDFIQTDASINPGNSGGALVDAEGRLVGINTAILSRSGANNGVGFAVPVNLARQVMDRLVTDGKVTRGYLGVLLQELTPELAEEFDLKESTGALVGEVTRRSPAERAGLQQGDVIKEVDGRKVTDGRQLRLLISQARPGTEIKLKVVRAGKEENLTAKLEQMPAGGLSRATGDRPGRDGWNHGSREADALDGITIDEIDARARRQFDIPLQLRGALVVDVAPDSAGGEAGLRAGDVIVEINRHRVTSAEEALALGEEVKDGRVLLRVWSRGLTRYVVLAPPARR